MNFDKFIAYTGGPEWDYGGVVLQVSPTESKNKGRPTLDTSVWQLGAGAPRVLVIKFPAIGCLALLA